MPVRRPGPGTLVTVVGLARSGIAAARWLLKLGCLVRVTEVSRDPALQSVADELAAQGAWVECGRHTPAFIRGSHLIVVSPGVPLTAPPIRWARQEGIPVVSEIELGSWYTSGRMVAVTGSNGKSTVVTLVGEILKAAGREVVIGGNIGQPLCGLLPQIQPSTVVVLEVSSFQLETSLSFHSEVAAVLNVSPNHLDRHGSLADYLKAKARLLAYQGSESWAVLNADDPTSQVLKRAVRCSLVRFSRTRSVVGACVEKGWLRLALPDLSGPICPREALFKPGGHHEENALAASCVTGLLGVPPQTMGEVLRSFKGLAHRQEVVATIRGVTFVNDSKSTTVASGLRAIQAAPGRVILIAGGRDKGSDFRSLRSCRKKLKAAVLMGEDGPKIASHLRRHFPIRETQTLPEAVKAAFEMAQPGEWILLSPMCTSFDMFRDFEERGERFTEEVRRLCGT